MRTACTRTYTLCDARGLVFNAFMAFSNSMPVDPFCVYKVHSEQKGVCVSRLCCHGVTSDKHGKQTLPCL